jgi:hypothetical protein
MMNIFRILGEFVQLPAHAVGVSRDALSVLDRNADICSRRSLPPVLHLDFAAQNEDIERATPPNSQQQAHHLTSIQSASGISFKSQFLYLIVYITRYMDLLWTFYKPAALYNTVFKIVFISTSAYTVYLMLTDYKPTHDPNLDTFKVQYLILGSAILACAFPYEYRFHEVGSFGLGSTKALMLRADTLGVLYMA